MYTFKELMNRFTDFSLSTFKEATPLVSLVKLQEEIQEVKDAMDNDVWGHFDKPALAEEYADCIMCLMDSAARNNISGEELEDALVAKVNKNISRTWVKNNNGTYSHVK